MVGFYQWAFVRFTFRQIIWTILAVVFISRQQDLERNVQVAWPDQNFNYDRIHIYTLV